MKDKQVIRFDHDMLRSFCDNNNLKLLDPHRRISVTDNEMYTVDSLGKGMCHLCQVNFTSRQFAYDHVNGKAHKKMEEGFRNRRPRSQLNRLPDVPEDGVNNDLTCAICQVVIGSFTDYNNHIQGKKHTSAMQRRNIISNALLNRTTEPQDEVDVKASIPLTSIRIIPEDEIEDMSDDSSSSSATDDDIAQAILIGKAISVIYPPYNQDISLENPSEGNDIESGIPNVMLSPQRKTDISLENPSADYYIGSAIQNAMLAPPRKPDISLENPSNEIYTESGMLLDTSATPYKQNISLENPSTNIDRRSEPLNRMPAAPSKPDISLENPSIDIKKGFRSIPSSV